MKSLAVTFAQLLRLWIRLVVLRGAFERNAAAVPVSVKSR